MPRAACWDVSDYLETAEDYNDLSAQLVAKRMAVSYLNLRREAPWDALCSRLSQSLHWSAPHWSALLWPCASTYLLWFQLQYSCWPSLPSACSFAGTPYGGSASRCSQPRHLYNWATLLRAFYKSCCLVWGGRLRSREIANPIPQPLPWCPANLIEKLPSRADNPPTVLAAATSGLAHSFRVERQNLPR